ncbi:unnamed protein product, partial [Nesidiocoris tenuis]
MEGVPPPTHDSALPRVQVPIFSGDLGTFANFNAIYKKMVHEGPYSNTVKLTYLRSFLKGEPLQLIENLAISDANYPLAYNKIQKMYGASRTLASFYLNKLFEFKPLTNDSYADLQSFLTVFDSTYQAYLNVDIPYHEDYLLVHMCLNLLPKNLRLMFERSFAESDDVPSYSQVIKFVNDQCRVKALMGEPKPSRVSRLSITPPACRFPGRRSTTLLVTPSSSAPSDTPLRGASANPPILSPPPSTSAVCPFCSSAHAIYTCDKFKRQTSASKLDWAKSNRRCFRCLGNHSKPFCNSAGKCTFCRSLHHHSYLHEAFDGPVTAAGSPTSTVPPSGRNVSPASRAPPNSTPPSTSQTLLTSPASVVRSPSSVLLGTVQALIRDKWGSWSPIRLVLDVGSQLNLISDSCVRRLALPIQAHQVQLCGAANQPVCSSKGIVDCVVGSRHHFAQWAMQAAVVSRVCAPLPTVSVASSVCDKFKTLELADSTFDAPAEIDFLLGAANYVDILKPNGGLLSGNPSAFETMFGWVIVGSLPSPSNAVVTPALSLCITEQSLHDSVQKFWASEEVTIERPINPIDEKVEAQFVETHTREPSGRYQVRLPFCSNPLLPPFGDSRLIAERRWLNVERKLRCNESLRSAYHAFMREFIDLGHMSPATTPGTFVIPHFAIQRDSSTSPVRVVFDGSCRDTSGLSLNDRLLTGPSLQKDIAEIVTLFRLAPVAVTCDIEKMFRNVKVDPRDRHVQRVLYRERETDPLVQYEINTLVYGLSSSPFLAQRTLQRLVADEGAEFPLASKAILECCFMDDIAYALSDLQTAKRYKDEMVSLMRRGGFELRKWASNSIELLQDIPAGHQSKLLTLTNESNPSLHILGVVWHPTADHFSYRIAVGPVANTKRSILSQVASIYDPIGWVSPVVFWAKAFLQELWIQGLDWDTPLPPPLLSRWAAYAHQLPQLENVVIPRLCLPPGCDSVQFVGMCDASSLGFGAVVYLRCCVGTQVHMALLKAKTKVAPLKTQTIPRLELCAALLLAKLISSLSYLRSRLAPTAVYLFSDSQVVLAWLRSRPHTLKTYVANRVVTIMEMTDHCEWRHIPTKLNAADCASRGLQPSELVDYSLWWRGPDFLTEPIESWPAGSAEFPQSLPELKPGPPVVVATTTASSSSSSSFLELIGSVSSLERLRRVVAWVSRFCQNARAVPADRSLGRLQVDELERALHLCVRATQQHYFASELSKLDKRSTLSPALRKLTPFLDSNCLLRVGGRLQHSTLADHSKHPLILPKTAPLSALVCDYYHQITLHGGAQVTQATLQSKFWILSARSLVRKRIHRCLTCYRETVKPTHPQMADLPPARVTQDRVFADTGVDFAGPFLVKQNTSRRAREVKAYMCIFVCTRVKAVHIELVGSLSTASYQAALERFVARRGLCRNIFCDQGRNFVGAAREMEEIRAFLQQTEEDVGTFLSTRNVEYRFNPPLSPWMGGLWEAAVKSAKTHLRRITSGRLLTYEEMATLLARVEAVLNSRPLCPLSSTDPHAAPSCLTPGHFLVGGPLIGPPEYNLLGTKDNLLDRWQAVQRASQEFWRSWHKDYLHTLIQRSKWNQHREAPSVGEPVFVYGVQSRPLEWPLGIVEKLLPGADGIPRAADVRTATGLYRRPVAALVPLPQ